MHLITNFYPCFQVVQRAQAREMQPSRELTREEGLDPATSHNKVTDTAEPDDISIRTAEELLQSCGTNILTLDIVEGKSFNVLLEMSFL